MMIWNRMNLSLLGRISTVKMTILPKMMFLFQTLPIISGACCFKEGQRDIQRYVWNEKKLRIKYKILIDDKRSGGFSLPDMRLYYEASCISWLKEWFELKNVNLFDLEGFDNWYGWHAYLWYGKVDVHKAFKRHLIRRTLYSVWCKYKLLIARKTPLWLSPLEAIAVKRVNMVPDWPTYRELLSVTDRRFKLRSREELQDKVTTWLHYQQLYAIYKKR